MKKAKVVILQAPGTNCDRETAFAFQYVGADVDFISVFSLVKDKTVLEQYQILCIPGGFTYGDDISAGRVLANQIRFLLKEEMIKFYQAGKLMLGICNGFQVLIKSGILPYGPFSAEDASLVYNTCGHFMDRWVHLKVRTDHSLWLRDIEPVVLLPIAHAEGRFVVKGEKALQYLENNKQVALQYSSAEGEVSEEYNPNGSLEQIAGITDPSGRILGMMPHPERNFISMHSPFWSMRTEEKPAGQGFMIFKNGVDYAKEHLL